MISFSFEDPGSISVDSPFSIRVFKNVLSAEIYHSLQNEFPTPDESWRIEKEKNDNKTFIHSRQRQFDDAIRKSEIWSSLTTEIMSEKFQISIGNMIYPILLKYNKENKISPAIRREVQSALENRDTFLDFLVSRTHINLQLSSLKRGEYNSPHTDDARKLATLLAYFPYEDWRPEYGGETRFLRFRDGKIPDWFDPSMNRVPEEILNQENPDLEVFFTSRYEPNSWSMFCKSIDSFHEVSEVKCPEHMNRRTMVMTLQMHRRESDEHWQRIKSHSAREN
ncbi:hypothetical protein [Nisaea sp.]|uniref:hypothetical protein n=1 Tax=Nisaea sp. TaxID=2024842 RepID=UPI003B52F1ED